MAWTGITTDEILEEFTPDETAVIGKIQGIAANLASILARVVGAARGAILAGGNSLGQVGTIPDQIHSDVIAIARWQWLISLPVLKSMQTDGRKDAAAKAQERLDKIAAGKPPVEIPDNPLTTTAPGPGPNMNHPHRHFSRRKQQGL